MPRAPEATYRVFVYGSLRRGQGNHGLLDGARFAGEAETLPRWAMLDLGAFPGVVPGCDRVRGEVYDVDAATLAALDRLEGHPRFYRRRPVELADGTRAAMYVLTRPDHYLDRPQIAGGDWRRRRDA